MTGKSNEDEKALQEHIKIAREGNKGFPPPPDQIEYHHEEAKKLVRTLKEKPKGSPKK